MSMISNTAQLTYKELSTFKDSLTPNPMIRIALGRITVSG